jgi:hypothetical protein
MDMLSNTIITQYSGLTSQRRMTANKKECLFLMASTLFAEDLQKANAFPDAFRSGHAAGVRGKP